LGSARCLVASMNIKQGDNNARARQPRRQTDKTRHITHSPNRGNHGCQTIGSSARHARARLRATGVYTGGATLDQWLRCHWQTPLFDAKDIRSCGLCHRGLPVGRFRELFCVLFRPAPFFVSIFAPVGVYELLGRTLLVKAKFAQSSHACLAPLYKLIGNQTSWCESHCHESASL
jgi:hypothetical protein